MRVLITGITGRIGANVARSFLHNGHDVRGFVWPGDHLFQGLRRHVRHGTTALMLALRALVEAPSLAHFVRSLVGMDREAAQAAFS